MTAAAVDSNENMGPRIKIASAKHQETGALVLLRGLSQVLKDIYMTVIVLQTPRKLGNNYRNARNTSQLR